MGSIINIEIVYALPEEQTLLTLSVPAGETVAAAIKLSGLMDKHPEIDLTINKLGIFGKVTNPETPLRDKDRIEIYRPLIADPKDRRRKRVAENKS
jgi:putative ubiquitin-RnfH superfamily antitoxin RatB of RatAB toxin-antitoxin module